MNFFKQNKYIIILILITTFSFICWLFSGITGIIKINNSDSWWKWKVVISQNFNNLFKSENSSFLTNSDLIIFQESMDIIINNFYSANSISKKDLVYWMIKWVVESLKDKHSEFFNIDETKKFNETLSWDFEWIWAVIAKSDFWVLIERIIAGSPAKEYWLLAGDIIIKADNIELKDMNVNEAVNKIRWPAGSKVKLEILRKWEKEILTKEVIRKKINVPSVDSKILDNNIWYIMLSIFWEKTWDEFEKILKELNSKNIKWLIIDLRDNWWGYLQTAVSVLSNFVEKDKLLVTTKEKNILNNKAYFSFWNDNKKIPIILLINWNSASASEITAGALKDYDLAILVWEKSYWKWSVQEPFILSDWSELKITVAKWYTPLDNLIDWIWIKPDFEVNFIKEDIDNKFDRQLDRAKTIMNKFIDNSWDIKKTKEFFNLEKQKELKEKLNKTSSWTTN